MARGRPTDPEIVMQVQAALLAGMAVTEAARKWSLPERTVRRLNGEIGRLEGGEADELGRRLAELLLANAEGMMGIARVAKDENYLKAQQAGGLAQLYAVLADTTIRLLEAAELAGVDEEPDRPTD